MSNGPFSAQIQRALAAIGFIPGSGASGFSPYIGSSGVRMTGGGRIAQVITPVANAADTDFVFMPLVLKSTGQPTLPAGFMANDGDTLVARVSYSLSAAVSSKTYQLNIGYTATGAAGFTGGTNIYSSGTSTASTDVIVEAYLVRLSSSQMAYWAQNQFLTAAVQGQQYTTAARTWANAANIGLSARDGSSNASAITINYAELWYYPALAA